MKKLIKSLIFAVILTSSLITVHPPKAHAVLAITSTGGLAIIYAIGAGLHLGINAPITAAKGSGWAFLWGILGTLFLDENRQVIVFKSLDPETATKYDLSIEQLEAYNTELSLINLASDEVASQTNGKELTQDQAREIYLSVTKEIGLSKVSMTALEKIVEGTLKEIK